MTEEDVRLILALSPIFQKWLGEDEREALVREFYERYFSKN